MKRFFTRKVTRPSSSSDSYSAVAVSPSPTSPPGGTGTGSATVGSTGPTDFAVTQSGPTGTMYPGAAAVPFTVRAQNTGTGDEHVDDITIAVASDPETGTRSTPAVTRSTAARPAGSSRLARVGGRRRPTLSPGDYSDPADSSIGLSESGTDEDACRGVVGLRLRHHHRGLSPD